ncbi:MAG: TetR/AcrR family transcriptional regulator [Clostridiales bacterium]|nr:TetR/AcrR family transcriptional regulator [Clostridiales bacterium]
MDYTLANIDSDKKDRIINAAIEEFSLYPYEKASTNNIVKSAGISKGLLFHYFKSKQDLYDKLVGFVINKMYDEITEKIDWHESDIFERIKQIAIIKMKISKVYPNMFDFMLKVISRNNVKKLEDSIKLYEKYGIDFQSVIGDVFTKNIDYSKFRDQSTIAQSINVIRWTIEKYGEEQILALDDIQDMDFEKAINDMDEYISILKKTFYK